MVTKYIIKARPDDIQQFNPEVGPGLSARDATGQTANVTLTSLEIGLKVTDDFQFDTGGRLTLNDNVSATSIQLPDTTPTNSANSTLVNTKKQELAFPFSKYYEAEIIAPNASTSTWQLTHGLGGKPTFTYITYVCIEDDNGYVVGDEIPFNAPNNISNNHGPTIMFNDTQFKFRTYGNVYVTDIDSGSVLATTFDHWKWRIKAWR